MLPDTKAQQPQASNQNDVINTPSGVRVARQRLSAPLLQQVMQNTGVRIAQSPTGEYDLINPASKRGYWENPYRVARYHNYIRSQAPGWQAPEWLPVQQIEAAYKYLDYKNEGKPWYQWKYLADDDSATQTLRNIPAPPVDYLFPAEAAEIAQQKKAEQAQQAAVGSWQKLSAEQGGTPLFGIEGLPSWQQVAMTLTSPQPITQEDETGRPTGSKLGANAIRSVLAGLGGSALTSTAVGAAGVAAFALTGSAALLAAAPAIAIVGGVAFGLATMYQLSSGKDAPVIGGLINEHGKVFNWAAEQLEKTIGVSEQMVDAVIENDGDMEAILKNIPDAYKASTINYETNAQNLIYNALASASGDQPAQPGEVFRLDLGQPEPQKLPEGIKYGVEALDDARERIMAGEDPQKVFNEYNQAFGASGYLNDYVLQSILDPMNLAPTLVETGVSKVADLSGNTRLQAAFPKPTITNAVVDALPFPVNMLVPAVSGGKLQGTQSILQGMQKYGTFIRTGVMPGMNGVDVDYKPPADYSNLEKSVGGLDDLGIPKEYMPAKTPETAGQKIKYAIDWLTNLTPEAKARAMQADLMDHFMRIMDNADDPTQMVEIVKSMSQVDAKTTGDALAAILNPAGKSPIEISPSTFNSPLGTAFAVAIQKLIDSGAVDELYLSKWQSSADRRAFLIRAAELMEIKPGELLSRLNKDVDVASVLKTKAREQGIEGFENLTNQNLKDLLGVFTGKDSLPWHSDLFKLELKNLVDDSLQEFMVNRFGLKPDAKFFRIAHVMKDIQSMLLLGLNPAYLVNNTINNIITRSAVGVFGYMSGKDIGDILTRYEIEPYRPDAGLQKYGLAAEYGIKEDGQSGKISAVKRGERDLLSAASGKIGKLKDSVSLFSKISAAVERSESRQAYTIAFRQMQNNLWKPGIGFSKMQNALEMELDKLSPDLKERIYAAMSGAANKHEIDTAMFDPNAPLKVDGLVDQIAEQMAAQHSSIVSDPARYKELLITTGIADQLNAGLAKAKSINDVDTVFDSVLSKTNEHIRKMLSSEIADRVVEVKNRVAQGGIDEAISLYVDMVMAYKKEWVRHFMEIDELQRSPYIDYQERNKQWNSQNQWDTMRFDELNDWEDATYRGIFQALGKIDDPLVKEFLDSYKQTHDNWRKFYDKKNKKLRALFEKDYTEEQYNKVNDEIAEMAANAYILEENLQLRADELYTQIVESMGGDAQKASIYRTAMRVIRQEMTQSMTDFRADLIANPPRNRTERLARWSKFIEEIYTPKIGELKRVEMVGAQQINNDPNITKSAGASIPFMMTKNMREKLSTLGYSAEDISKMTPQQAWEKINAFNPSTIASNGLSDIPRVMPTGKALSELADDYLNPMIEALRESYKAEFKSNRKLAFDEIPDYLKPQVKQWINQVKSEMPGVKLASMKYAEQMRDSALLNYSKQTGFDKIFSIFYPYQFWYTHSMINWAMRMVEKPGLYSMYYRYRQMQEKLEADGIPQRLRGKIRIATPYLPDWMGDGIWIDPTKQLFPFSQFMDPVDRMAQRENSIKYAAYDILDQMVKNGDITKDQASAAKETQQGEAWDQAYAAAKNQTDFSDPMTLASMLMPPAMYLSVPHYIMSGQSEKISPTPLLRYSKAIETALSGTKLDVLGKGIGLLGEPERKLREKAMTPGKAMFGEFGDYYIDRQLANMVADGKIGLKEAQQAMIDRSGAAYESALERVRNEVAVRAPGILPLLAVKNGASAPDVAFSLLISLFPAGLLPSGELEVIQKQPEYTEAWNKYKLGDKQALTEFYNDNPEFEARTAMRDEPQERLHQFLVSEVYDRYFAQPQVNRAEINKQLGQNFVDSFLNKSTKDTNGIPDETLAQWANMLGGNVPDTVNYQQPENRLDLWPTDTANAYSAFQDERNKLFPTYSAIQTEYYNLPKSKRAAFLRKFPELKQYWQWKDQYATEHPEIAPILASNSRDAEMRNNSVIDYSQMDSDLANQIQYANYTGENLSPGAWMALEYQWEKLGKPYDSLKEWVNNEILAFAN